MNLEMLLYIRTLMKEEAARLREPVEELSIRLKNEVEASSEFHKRLQRGESREYALDYLFDRDTPIELIAARESLNQAEAYLALFDAIDWKN